MKERVLNSRQLELFARKLREDERSAGTIENYLRHIRAFAAWAGGQAVTKDLATQWKEHLISQYRPGTVNTMLVSLNRFFAFLGWYDCQVKTLRIQRRLFREESKELTRAEYERLVSAAQASGRERLVLLLETICSTGIRVSEVKYITVEALKLGKAEISLKGKIRTILLPNKLCRKLLKYAKKKRTVSGEVFLTRNGTSLSRKQIWAEMKSVCEKARVAASKVFPSQPAAPVCQDLLQSLPGRGPAGGRAGALQHRDHQDLSDLYGGGTCRNFKSLAAYHMKCDKMTILSKFSKFFSSR